MSTHEQVTSSESRFLQIADSTTARAALSEEAVSLMKELSNRVGCFANGSGTSISRQGSSEFLVPSVPRASGSGQTMEQSPSDGGLPHHLSIDSPYNNGNGAGRLPEHAPTLPPIINNPGHGDGGRLPEHAPTLPPIINNPGHGDGGRLPEHAPTLPPIINNPGHGDGGRSPEHGQTLPPIRTNPGQGDGGRSPEHGQLPPIRINPGLENGGRSREQQPTLPPIRINPGLEDGGRSPEHGQLPPIRINPGLENSGRSREQPTQPPIRINPGLHEGGRSTEHPSSGNGDQLPPQQHKPNSGCVDFDEDRLKRLEDWAKEHVVSLKPNAENKLKTGDVITTSDNAQTLKMPNGDVLKVNKDGSYELKTTTGKVKEVKFDDGTKSYTLTYPNGDSIHFGNDPVTKQGRIFAIERKGFSLGIERP